VASRLILKTQALAIHCDQASCDKQNRTTGQTIQKEKDEEADEQS